MSISILIALAGLGFIASLAAGIWLCLHLTSVAHAFEGTADVVSAGKSPRFSPTSVITAVIVLLGGALICILIAIAVITGFANDVFQMS